MTPDQLKEHIKEHCTAPDRGVQLCYVPAAFINEASAVALAKELNLHLAYRRSQRRWEFSNYPFDKREVGHSVRIFL